MPEQEGKRRAKHGQQTEEDGRKLETRKRQEQESIKRAAKLVRLNGSFYVFFVDMLCINNFDYAKLAHFVPMDPMKKSL